MSGLPRYVWQLLEAAKVVSHPPINATPEMLVCYQQQLEKSVAEFELRMPVVDGCVVVSDD